jgi:uncharacterized membrane protein
MENEEDAIQNHREHQHPSTKKKPALGQRAADALTIWVGSWTFIILMVVVIVVWIGVNIVAFALRWDPYPFILLNLVLSCVAALQAPVILMSQNRETERDRLRAKYDYQVDRKAEREIHDMQKELREIKRMIEGLSASKTSRK